MHPALILHARNCLRLVMDGHSKLLQVYVVEDSPIILRLLTATIEAAGAELVGHSPTAQQALVDLAALQPDLILVDISLSSGNGFDVLKTLQERGIVPSAMKVVLTNHANAEYEDLSYRLGADKFFDKASGTSKALALISTLAIGARHGAARPDPDRRDSGERGPR
jgi:DNA-binding NarL/FixJ family response regulator